MNDINFTKSVSRAEQQLIKRWAITTTVTTSMLFFGILMLQLYQLVQFLRLGKECATLQTKTRDFDGAMNKKQELLQQKATLTKRISKLAQRTNNPKIPTTLLADLKPLLGKTVQLQSIAAEKNKITITALAQKTTHATQFVAQLAERSALKEIKLISLKNYQSEGTHGTQFTIEAKRVW